MQQLVIVAGSPIGLAVGPDGVVGPGLRCVVGGAGPIGRLFGEHLVGVEGQVPVDLAGGDVVEPGHPVAAGRLGQGLGPDHVGLEEPRRIQDGQTVVGFGREIHDDVDVVIGQGRGHTVEVTDVALHEGDPVLHIGQVGPVACVGEHVEGHDGVIGMAVDPVADEVGSDEPGTAGHEQSHNGSVAVTLRPRPA